MKIHVHVKEKKVKVECGEGNQRIIWLAHVGLARYDSKFGMELGIPKGVQTDDGELQNPETKIKDVLKDGQTVWIVLLEEEVTQKVSKEVLNEIMQ